MSKFIPLSVPNLKGNELEYVIDAVKKEWVSTGGAYINQFEKDLAQYVGAQEAVACQSGTAGLHLSLLVSGVEYGEEVIVPTLTFIAAVNPVKYLGAEPVFMDCDDTLTMDPQKLEEFCETQCRIEGDTLIHNKTNKKIKAVVVVHIFGNMADMEKIMKIARQYKLKVIEDATEALGTYYTDGIYKGKYAGTIGDFGVYSFNGNKIITTGGGGMIVSTDVEMLRKIKYLSTQAKDDELYYIHGEIGYNYRMTNLQAALGVAQLEQLEQFIEVKRNNYELYREKMQQIDGLELLGFREDIRPNYWFYSLLIDDSVYGKNRDELLQLLNQNKIQTRPIWGLIHEQKPYMHNEVFKVEKAKIYIKEILNIPCSSNLTPEDVLIVIDSLIKIKES